MSEFELRLSFLCYLKGVSFETAQRVVELRKKYNSWDLNTYAVRVPADSTIKKIRMIVEDIESTTV